MRFFALTFRLMFIVCIFTHLSLSTKAKIKNNASDWVKNEQSAVRLISSSKTIGKTGRVQLGLQFKLKDGWKI